MASLGLGVKLFAMTRETEGGISTSVALRDGTKSINLAVFILPIKEMVWSMPPHAVPANLSAEMTSSAKVA